MFELNGKKVIKAVYTGLETDEIISMSAEVNAIVLAYGQEIYGLADFRGVSEDLKILEYLQNDESKAAAEKFSAIATVGLNGMKRLFLNVYTRVTKSSARLFKNEKEALEWLNAQTEETVASRGCEYS